MLATSLRLATSTDSARAPKVCNLSDYAAPLDGSGLCIAIDANLLGSSELIMN